MLAVLMEDTRYFRIGDRQYEFKDKDEIFPISGPTPKKESLLAESAQCTSCFSNFKSVKSVAYWYAIIYFFFFQIYDSFYLAISVALPSARPASSSIGPSPLPPSL